MEDSMTDIQLYSHMETRGESVRIEVLTDSSADSPLLKSSQPRDPERTLRKDKRAISLGGGLNRLNLGLDEPDGDFPPEQSSFLHSKYAPLPAQSQSVYSLADSTQSDSEQRKKEKEKKKNRLSKGLMEFINMGDPLGYADKKLVKSFAALPSEEQNRKKSQSMAELNLKRQKERSFVLSNDNTGSSNNGDHSDRSNTEHSPPVLRVRRKTVNAENKERRRTESQLIVPKESENTKIVTTATKLRKSGAGGAGGGAGGAPIVPQVQELPVPAVETTQPVDLPPLPAGRTLLDMAVPLNIEQLFGHLFTDCQFYRTWLFDPRRQVDTKNLSATDWIRNETTGLMERDLTYDRFQDFVITSATIKVSQKQTQQQWTTPGSAYGIDLKITNKGAPYADSFVITEHYRLTSTGHKSCHMVIIASVDFLKYSFVKGKIESESWAGLNKGYTILRETLLNIDNSNQRSVAPREAREMTEDKAEFLKNDQSEKVENREHSTRINMYPENYQYTGQLILMVILLILTMLVISLFKLASTLEKIDQRLSNIEHIFNLR